MICVVMTQILGMNLEGASVVPMLGVANPSHVRGKRLLDSQGTLLEYTLVNVGSIRVNHIR